MLRVEPASKAAFRELVLEYAESLGVDLSFQKFDEELEHLDRYYELMLLAVVDRTLQPHESGVTEGTADGTAIAGCVALRRIDDNDCEMKRLYVRPSFRGLNIGRSLALRAIAEARIRGYRRMLLDTLPGMSEAMRLYESLGFAECEAYRFNPIAGSKFLQLIL